MFEDKRLIRPFLTAIDNVNRDPNVLPGVQLETIINITKPQDAFDSLKAGMYATLKGTTYLMHFYFSSTSVSIHIDEFSILFLPSTTWIVFLLKSDVLVRVHMWYNVSIISTFLFASEW